MVDLSNAQSDAERQTAKAAVAAEHAENGTSAEFWRLRNEWTLLEEQCHEQVGASYPDNF